MSIFKKVKDWWVTPKRVKRVDPRVEVVKARHKAAAKEQRRQSRQDRKFWRCPCGNLVSRSAKACPQCGKKTPQSVVGCIAALAICVVVGTIIGVVMSGNDLAPDPNRDHYITAVATVRQNLKAPSTAEFSNSADPASSVRHYGGPYWEASGYVDAQNSFGAMLRQDWTLIWNDVTNDILYFQLGNDVATPLSLEEVRDLIEERLADRQN